jgi:hypothetical protein
MSTGNRWTVVLGSGGELLAAHEGAATEDYDGLTPVEVVPCDDAALGRAVEAVNRAHESKIDSTWRELLTVAFRAAGDRPEGGER